jgi:hypothetical protein
MIDVIRFHNAITILAYAPILFFEEYNAYLQCLQTTSAKKHALQPEKSRTELIRK